MPAYVYMSRRSGVPEQYYVLMVNQSAPEAPVYFGQGTDFYSAVMSAEKTRYDSFDLWPLPPSPQKVAEYFRLEDDLVLVEEEPFFPSGQEEGGVL